jgi:hypothetical protein
MRSIDDDEGNIVLTKEAAKEAKDSFAEFQKSMEKQEEEYDTIVTNMVKQSKKSR